MKKTKRDNMGCLIAIILFIIFIAVVWKIILSFIPPDVNKAEKILDEDSKLIETVVDYLKNSDEDIYINKLTTYYDIDKIEDKEVVKAVEKLLAKGYDAIIKDGNTICFLRWTFWRDFGAGIAYSINGVDEPEIEYVKKLEPLSKDGWYYYEEN